MENLQDRFIHKFRPIYSQIAKRSPTANLAIRLMGGLIHRNVDFVREGYEEVWANYQCRLEQADTLEKWLYISGHDDLRRCWRIDGKLEYRSFDFVEFVILQAVDAIKTHFPRARSVTEYGCGYGRIILGIKKALPHLDCFGYELANSGVQIANQAAQKFQLDVKYAPLDYVNDPESAYLYPKTDLALTFYSLEQVPVDNQIAVKNMLEHSHLGSIHLEPVSENYPWSYGGILARLYSWQANYLKNFDFNIRALGLSEVQMKRLTTSHNPLMYPSLYVLKKV